MTTLERAEGVIVPPWLRDDVPAEHRDLAGFVAEIGADHDRPRTSIERWQRLRRVQAEIAAGPLVTVTRADVRAWWFGRGQFRADGTPRLPATRRAMRDHLRAFIAWPSTASCAATTLYAGCRPSACPDRPTVPRLTGC
jgi:hypothetical protein